MRYFKYRRWAYVLISFVCLLGFTAYLFLSVRQGESKDEHKPQIKGFSSVNAEKMKKERSEYFFRLLRDPKTNRIPAHIRKKELRHAATMPRKLDTYKTKSANSIQSIENVEWQALGPGNVGGRTRALEVDIDNPNTIIAGGVSGGIWKSTDGGASWAFKNTTADRLSVTWLIQDITSANHDTWYYATGEYSGNTAGDNGAAFAGNGIYRSTDNGETWNQLAGTGAGNDTGFNSKFDYISRLTINPATGSLFMASHIGGIYKYNTGTGSFDLSLGGFFDHRYTDITAGSNGDLIAVLSESRYGGTSTNSPGVYRSSDDGATWTDITPGTFPSEFDRSFAAFSPSAPDTAYIITSLGMKATTSPNDSVAFHMIDLNTGGSIQTEDRSANMPDFGKPVGEIVQSNYNMILAVKPDDPDFVLLGFTDLYRSRDGFKTPATNKNDVWIGGYAPVNDISTYPNHHPDQHSIAFDPANTNSVWSGHDGGLSYTTDITTAGSVTWQNENNGYDVTQYYDVSIADQSGDQRVIGGTQDNGSPIFFTNVNRLSQADASTGDGGFSYLGDNFLYASSQNGHTRRYSYNDNGLGGYGTGNFANFAEMSPPSATDQLFVNPFAVDPNDETVIFYPSGNALWRNTDIEDPTTDGSYNIDGWENMTNLSPAGGRISAIKVSDSAPGHRLYYASYRSSNTPLIYRVDNAYTATDDAANLTDISIPGAPSGANVANIAVNPLDGNELIAVMSNYDITGLYYSANGGSSWTAVEGNLTGGSGSNYGPSLRDAAIITEGAATIYMVATSTGVYSTKTLNGASTTWNQEGADEIGNVVTSSLAHRASDNTIIAGTHGRGLFGKIPKERKITGNAGWRMLSAPIENMPISDITNDTPIQGFGDGEAKNFYTGYDGTNFTAPANLSGTLTSGKGFILYLFDNNQAGSSDLPIPVSAEGSEPGGDVTVNLHANGDLFNLVGNPYNAPIDFDAVTRNEVENKWWVWDNATSQYLTYNGTTGVSEPNNDGHIAPWQGFFVKAQAGAGTPSMTFSQDDKTHYDPQFYETRKKNNQKVRTISFEVTGENLIDENTVAVFYKGGKPGYDAGDMEEIRPLASTYFSLAFQATIKRDKKILLANDARSLDIGSGQTFKLQATSSKAGQYTMRWDFAGIPNTWKVELYDRQSQRIINMRETSGYEFEVQASNKDQNRSAKANAVAKAQDDSRFELRVKPDNDEEGSRTLPTKFGMSQNYPNPFTTTSRVKYKMAKAEKVRIVIYNSIGQRVATVVDTRKNIGTYEMEFDASGLASGIYFCRMQAGDFAKTIPMTVIK